MFTGQVGKGLALPALALFFALASQAQVIAGSGTVQASDACWSGGALFTTIPITPPGTTGVIRYGAQFSCTIPVLPAVPYLLTFHFVEPCGPAGGCSSPVVAGQRVFSVAVNGAPAFADLDIFAAVGALKLLDVPLQVASTYGFLRFEFTTRIRTAALLSIDVQAKPPPALTPIPCPTTATNPTLYTQLQDGSCLPVIIIGGNFVSPQVLVGIDGQTGRGAFYFHEARPPGFNGAPFNCGIPPSHGEPGALNPDTGLLADCMTLGYNPSM